MPALGRKINLLPPSEFESSFWGKFIKWAVTAGRYVVIVTEMIVVLAFLSRFKLDTDLNNLNKKIDGQSRLLEATAGEEKKFKNLQMRIEWAKALMQVPITGEESFRIITESAPAGVRFSVLSFDGKTIRISASAESEQQMGQFLGKLSRNPVWKSVELNTLAEDEIKGLTFNVIVYPD